MNKNYRSDPRVAKAKELLMQVLTQQQKSITGVKPAQEELKTDYEEIIQKFANLRGGKLYYPYISSGVGRGALVQLTDGSVKYDFISGVGVHYLGHSHPKMLTAAVDAALEDTLMQGNLQQGLASVELTQRLSSLACAKGAAVKNVFLSSSGAMANENAFKIIFQKHSPAKRFLAFAHCFAGRSMIMAQVTDKPANRVGLPKVLDVDYVPFYNTADPQRSTGLAVHTLNNHLQKYPKDYAGMIFELIQGEGGYYPGERKFFLALMEILKRHNVTVFVDEIQTLGRTPELFAFQYFGLDKLVDVVSVGKMLQACATLYSDDYKPKPGLISQTYTAGSAAIHAANAILDEVTSGGYLGEEGKIVKLSGHFIRQLEALAQKYPSWIAGPFGFGGMIAMTVFNGAADISRNFLQRLFQNGVLAFEAGGEPMRIRFLMPLGSVTTDDIDQVARIIEQTLTETAAQLKEK